jgi:ABC-type transport system substrate-binding protein
MTFALFAGCNKNEAVPPSDTTPTATPGANEGGDEDPTPDKIVSVQKDVINVGIETDLINYYPWQTRSNSGWEAAIHGLYQPLIACYPGVSTYDPCLMKSYEISGDGLTMEGELFDYIHDSQGNKITVDDVIFSYEKYGEVIPRLWDVIDKIEKTSDYTFTVTFRHTLELNQFGSTFGNIVIVSEKAFESSPDDMKLTPVGTGPYKLVSRSEGYSFTYSKVDDYWQKDEDYKFRRDYANVNTINWYVIGESAQRTIALEQKTIDICSYINAVDLNKFDDKNGYRVYSYDSVLSMCLYPNCSADRPTSDLNLRLAIGYAISTEAVLNSVYSGLGSVMHDAGPSWSNGYDKAWDNEENYYNYDPQKAAEYLSKSSYKGEVLKIVSMSNEASTSTSQIVANFLSQIGINTELVSYDGAVYNDYVKNPDAWDIMINTLPAGDGNYILAIQQAMQAKAHDWNGSVNFIFDDYLEELITNAMAYEATAKDVEALHKYMIENCAMMGLANIKTNVVVPDSLESVTLSYRNTIMPGGSVWK